MSLQFPTPADDDTTFKIKEIGCDLIEQMQCDKKYKQMCHSRELGFNWLSSSSVSEVTEAQCHFSHSYLIGIILDCLW